jgi:hypothetical protein
MRADCSPARKECKILDTLAAAHAEAGDFANAVRVQKEAIDLVPDEDLEHRKQHEYGLRLYQSEIPYRDANALARMALGLLAAGKYIEAELLARACLEARQVVTTALADRERHASNATLRPCLFRRDRR